jgi:NADPH:quinone reductase-like Zn-dependent oxidoreductase
MSPLAVQYDSYGDLDVLEVRELPAPVPGPGEALVAVRAAGINPGEASIRKGLLHERWPATFPSGQGSDLAGVVTAVGDGVTTAAVGDEVFGWVDTRASHAELVAAPVEHLMPKPEGLSWEAAGALHVVGATAWAAVRAVAPQAGEVVVVSGAAGGVGSLVVQLAARTGATVLGLASEGHHDWLRAHGATPLTYGDGVEERIRAAAGDAGVAALIDTYGGGYVDLAVTLGVAPERIDTIIDWAAAERVGAKVDGNAVGAQPAALSELAGLIATGELDLPIAKTYALKDVREAFADLEQRHTLGKIVLVP